MAVRLPRPSLFCSTAVSVRSAVSRSFGVRRARAGAHACWRRSAPLCPRRGENSYRRIVTRILFGQRTQADRELVTCARLDACELRRRTRQASALRKRARMRWSFFRRCLAETTAHCRHSECRTRQRFHRFGSNSQHTPMQARMHDLFARRPGNAAPDQRALLVRARDQFGSREVSPLQ